MPVDADEALETSRVRALHDLDVLDTPREERFVRLARTMFEVPMAAVDLVGAHRQWTQAEAGLPGLENTAPVWGVLDDTRAFVAAFSALLYPATGRVEYVDAGHGPASVLSADGYRRLEHSGPPLGVFPDSTWQTHPGRNSRPRPQRLVERATAFARTRGRPDDVTVLALRRTINGSTG